MGCRALFWCIFISHLPIHHSHQSHHLHSGEPYWWALVHHSNASLLRLDIYHCPHHPIILNIYIIISTFNTYQTHKWRHVHVTSSCLLIYSEREREWESDPICSVEPNAQMPNLGICHLGCGAGAVMLTLKMLRGAVPKFKEWLKQEKTERGNECPYF